MDVKIFQAALNIVISFFYLACLFLVFRKGNLKSGIVRLLAIYLSISISWCFLLTAGQPAFGDILSNEWGIRTSHYSVIFLIIISLILTYQKFTGGNYRAWLVYGVIWTALYYFLDSSPFSLDALLQSDQSLKIAQQSLANVILIGGWVIVMGEMVRYLTSLYQDSQQSLLKNQISYWTLALIFISMGDGLIFAEYILLGIILHWFGALIITCVLLFEKLPEIRQLEQYILYYLVTSVVTASVLVLSIYIALPLFQAVGRENPTFAGAVLTLSVAALLSLIWMLSARLVSRYVPLISNDPDRILHKYSQSISDILDAERLGQTAIQVICDEFDIQYGYLFIVDFDFKQEGSSYILKSLNSGKKGKPFPGILAEESIFSIQLNNKRRILKQSDIDLYQRMQKISEEEQSWLRELDAEIYIPIHTRDEWIGLFVLGPKFSDNPYFNNEIMLLSIMADQTAVALNNARLVESLMRLNNDFRRAYKALEQSNAHLSRINLILENLEKTKSSFINIASHELRKPLLIMRDYMEQWEEFPDSDHEFPDQFFRGISSGLKQIEEISNELSDVVSLDSRSHQLHIEPVGVHALSRIALENFSNVIDERKLNIIIENLLDLPQVEADPVGLQKVFYHLIANAIKFTPDGGSITISGQYLSTGEMEFHNGGIQITFSDDGAGIDPKSLDLFFKEALLSEELTNRQRNRGGNQNRGLGLGIAIAKGFIEAHRGKIWAESPGFDGEKSMGCKFHIALPLHYYDHSSSLSVLQYERVK